MKAKILISAVVATLAISPLSFAGHKFKHGHGNEGFFDHAHVVDVEPIMRSITVSVPQKECWEEQISYPQSYSYGNDNAGNMILGGIIGGVIGNRFGGGRGRDVATVAGTLIGASIGHDAAQRRAPRVTGPSVENVQRCQVTHQQHVEERIDGYQVTYRYKGELFTTRMPYDPGNKIRVKVNVMPVERF